MSDFDTDIYFLLFLFSLTHSLPPIFLRLSPVMHLFGLNWQLQESESYGAFENGGGVGRDTTPNTFMVSTDNGELLLQHTEDQKCSCAL